MPIKKYDCKPENICFMSSNTWDVSGGGVFGYNSIWINRFNKVFDKLSYKPKFVIKNLKEKLSKINEFIQDENNGLEELTNKRAGVEKEADEVGNIIYGQRDKISGIDKILADEADKIKRFKESKSNSG